MPENINWSDIIQSYSPLSLNHDWIAVGDNFAQSIKWIGIDGIKCINTGKVVKMKKNEEGEILCEHCDEISTCQHNNGTYLCDNHGFNCSNCGKYFLRGEVEEVDEEWVCNQCINTYYFRCSDCDVLIHTENDEWHQTANGNICNNCCENSYFWCEECEINRYNDDARNGGCIHCNNGPIKDYDYKPDPKFHGKGPHYYGIELEVEVKSDYDRIERAATVLDKFDDNFVYLKNDGSLRNGFEMVSQPASLEEHKKRWAKFIDNPPDGLLSYHTTSCGLHIHTNKYDENCEKTILSELTIGKILVFVNSPENSAFIRKLAQRFSVDYAAIAKKSITDGRKSSRCKYEAVNVSPEYTIEFRLFKGNLKKETFFRAIEFVEAVIEFCSPARHSIKDYEHLSKFIDFVKLQKITNVVDQKKVRVNRWPNLAEFIQKWEEKHNVFSDC